jgi:hypothetical protein
MEKINLVHMQLVQMCKRKRQATAITTFLWKYSFQCGWVVNVILRRFIPRESAPDSYLVGGWVRPSSSCTCSLGEKLLRFETNLTFPVF